MKAAISRWLAAAAAVLVIAFGCDSVINQVADEAAGGRDGFATVDSEFSDASITPGGIGVPDPGEPGTGPDTDGVELPSEETRSFFTAFQIDPVEEDTAGAKFVVAGDVDQDGLLDLVSGWNESQPVQLHLQRRDPTGVISFRTISLAGTYPVAVIAGVELGQINDDGWLDVVVLVKASGGGGYCPTTPPTEISRLEGEIIVYFSPGNATLIPDGDRWTQMILVNPYVKDRWIHNQFPGNEWVDFDTLQAKPENAGFTALAVGNLDGNPGDEIVVALNPGGCKELGQEPPVNTVDLWINPGPGLAETATAWGVPPETDIPLSANVPLSIMLDAPLLTDVALSDVDTDGDLDVIAAYSDAITLNVRWSRNPLIPSGFDELISGASDGDVDRCLGGDQEGTACANGDLDCEGIEDGVCQGGVCVGGKNPGADCTDSGGCAGTADGVCTPSSWHFVASGWEERPVGQLDTNANVVAIGDVDNDGYDDVLVRSTPGQIVQWFHKPNQLVIPPEFPPNDAVPDRVNFPWPVFTITEFTEQEPEAITLGDVTGDGLVELMVAVEGGVYWYDGTVGDSVYDPWFGNTIIQDDAGAADSSVQAPGGSGVGVAAVDTSTVINTLLVVDLDGDGRNDIVGTLDRRTGAGLSDDRLVWYRNTKTEE